MTLLRLPGYILNKYTVSAIILVSLLITDILLHKGMSRVMLPDNFEKGFVAERINPCGTTLLSASKNWVRGINDTALLANIPADVSGLELDAYWDDAKSKLLVFHDSGHYSSLPATELLGKAVNTKKDWSYWVDLKNITASNATAVLHELSQIRDSFGLKDRIIVESSDVNLLGAFCDSGFFSSYYVPFFNPYEISSDSLVQMIKSIGRDIRMSRPSAVSGYYFQYPVLKKAFPDMPILTWTDNASFSLVGFFFRRTLENDPQLKIVLQPTPVSQ